MANTAFQAFTIGKDMSLTIELINILGAVVPATIAGVVLDVSDIGYLEDFQAAAQHSTITVKPISHGGQSHFRDKFEHWEGSFNIARTGPSTDLLLQVLQDSLLASAGGAVSVNIVQTVYDPLGNANGNQVFVFMNATLSPNGGGNYSADGVVSNSFSFRATRRDILNQKSGIANAPSIAQTALLALSTSISKV
jgi:hypothetical protein